MGTFFLPHPALLVYLQSEAAARFDLNGCLIPPDSNIPTNIGLHHHGEEPNAPGYKLDELFQLARSNFLQQRVFALQMLARIMEQVIIYWCLYIFIGR